MHIILNTISPLYTIALGEARIAATSADAQKIFQFVDTIKDGSAYKLGAFVPVYSASNHSHEALNEYFKLCSSNYVKESSPRRFLIQKDMYNEVKSTDGTAVHIEANQGGSGGPPSGSSAWISVAAGNVLPDVLLRLTAGVLHPRKLNIWRAHLDQVNTWILIYIYIYIYIYENKYKEGNTYMLLSV